MIAYVQSATGAFSGGGSPSLAFGGDVGASDAILTFVSQLANDAGGNSITGIQDDRGNPYSLIGGPYFLNIPSGYYSKQNVYLYAAVNGAAQSVTVQPQIAGSPHFWLTVLDYSGAGIAFVDQSAIAIGFTPPMEVGPITTVSDANELLISYWSLYVNAARQPLVSGGTPAFVERVGISTDSLGGAYSYADAVVSSTGTYNCQWETFSSNSGGLILSLYFVSAAAVLPPSGLQWGMGF